MTGQTDETHDRCNHCGSRVRGLLCEFCGTTSRAMPSLEAELQAVEQLRAMLLAAPTARQLELLSIGYVPQGPGKVLQ